MSAEKLPIGRIMAGERLLWPLITIDFDASSLDGGTYPIEVGICRWMAPDRDIEGRSSLIKPTQEWIDHGSWSPASAEVHRIPTVRPARRRLH